MDAKSSKADKKQDKTEKKRIAEQLKTGIKTFGDEDMDSEVYQGEQSSTWRYQNPRIEQRGPFHSAMMQDDEELGFGDDDEQIHSSMRGERGRREQRPTYRRSERPMA
jgi:hypothetical protein